MASRFFVNYCVRSLATLSKAQTVFPCVLHISKLSELGKQGSSRLFIRYYAAAPNSEGSPDSISDTISLKDASKDRSKVIPVEVSMKYLKSEGNR